jgi:simple sugar transport system ATP-binding protein
MSNLEKGLSEKKKIKNHLLYAKGLKVKFESVVALDDVDFYIGKNEVVGLLGDNGAGKSTLIKTLIGLNKLQSGELYINGKKKNSITPVQSRKEGIEAVYQEPALVDDLSIARNFFLGKELSKGKRPFRFFDSPLMEKITRQSLLNLGLENIRDVNNPASSLSGGQRRLVALARCFYFGKKLLVLDEPTASLSESDIEIVVELVRKAKREGLSVIFVTHKAHEVFDVADRFVILDKGLNYLNLEKDETSLKEIEKILISSRLSAVRELAAGVAHQIRNPLGIIKASAEVLKDDFQVHSDSDNYKNIIDMIISEINTLNVVVSNFLDFANQYKLNIEMYSVEKLVRNALHALPTNKYPGINISVRIKNNLPSYPVDKSLTEQVLSNLVLNALQASKKGDEITITAGIDDKLRISIRDQGSGISEEIKKQIFNPFFTTKRNGTGLGLSIVHRIIDQLEGSIEIESAPGKGSVFTIEI